MPTLNVLLDVVQDPSIPVTYTKPLVPCKPIHLDKIRSRSRDVEHEIRLGKDGNVWCSCEHWKWQRGIYPCPPPQLRMCEHLKDYARKVLAARAAAQAVA